MLDVFKTMSTKDGSAHLLDPITVSLNDVNAVCFKSFTRELQPWQRWVHALQQVGACTGIPCLKNEKDWETEGGKRSA